MGPFTIGQSVRLECILKDYNGALTTGTVTCEVKDPSGNVASATTSTPETGTYYAFITVDEAGTWYYRFESAVATVSAGEASFSVNVTQFP
jgi:VCBS repeat-containing protein